MKKILIFGLSLLLSMLILGCSQSALRQGQNALKDKNYQTALFYLEHVVEEQPDNMNARLALARTYYHLQDYDKSEQQLNNVLTNDPDNSEVHLTLGMIKEAQQDYSAAKTIYSDILASGIDEKTARNIRGRLLYLQDSLLRQQVRQAIEVEQQLTTEDVISGTVGVLPFISADTNNVQLGYIAEGLAAFIWFDLASTGKLQLVERRQLKVLIDELSLARDSLLDNQSAPRLGKIVRAEQLVSGSIQQSISEEIALQSGLVDTYKSDYSIVLTAEEQLDQLMTLQKELTLAICDSLGVQLTEQERAKILQKQTNSFESMILFGRGIDSYDRGNYANAFEMFEQAVALDPAFGLATEMLGNTEIIMEVNVPLDQFEGIVLGDINIIEDIVPEINDALQDLGILAEDPRNEDLPLEEEIGEVSVGGSVK